MFPITTNTDHGDGVTKLRICLTRKELFKLITDKISEGSDSCFFVIEQSLSEKNRISYTLDVECKNRLRKLFSDLKKRWNDAHRTERDFLNKNAEWLETEVVLTGKNDDDVGEAHNDRDDSESRSSTGSTGRPLSKSSFRELSDRTKRRRTENIRQQFDPEELGYATQMSLRAKGKVDAAKLVKDVTAGSPSKASKYNKYLQEKPEETLSGDEAVALMIDNNLSKGQYIGIRSVSLGKNCFLLVTSDPLISSLRKLPAKKMRSLLFEAIELLEEPSIEQADFPALSTDEAENSDTEYDSD